MPGIKGQRRKQTATTLTQQVREAMRSFGTFTIPQIMKACNITRDAASKCVNAHIKTGHVVKYQDREVGQVGSHDVFRLMGLPEPPKKTTTDTQRQAAWHAIRILGTFTIPQVLATSGVSRDNASRYINRLIRAGYVSRHKERVSGRAGSCDVFRLLRNTGPEAPVCWESGQVYDPNNGKVYEDGDEFAS